MFLIKIKDIKTSCFSVIMLLLLNLKSVVAISGGSTMNFAAYIDPTIFPQSTAPTNGQSAICTGSYGQYRTTNQSLNGATPKKKLATDSSLSTSLNNINSTGSPIKFEIIPNPNNGTFSLSSPYFNSSTGQFYFSVVDAIGNRIIPERAYNIGDVIDGEILQNGVYYLNLRYNNSGCVIKSMMFKKA